MIVYTLAMLAFAWHLAARAPKVAASRVEEREEALVGAAAPHTPERRQGSRYAAGPGFEESLQSRQRGNIALMLTYLASALLVASVAMRGIAVARPPWGNMFEFATAASAAVGVAYSVLAKRNRWQWLGVFIVTPILLVLGLSLAVLYTEAGELMPALKSYWLGIHVSVAFIAVAFFTLAFAVGLLYLVRLRREESPPAKPNFIESLPSSATLERTAYSLNMVAFILWTFTLIAGAIWAKQAWGAYWQWDPKEVWTFVIWTVYAAYMHGRATAGVDHRKSMYIALAGYVCVIVNFTLVNLVSTFVGMHNYSGM
ncbi:c-type cytochrome biogenesis protein CcsB [Terrabacter sp. MAHUQ-38]|nr:c-type cytochrome biogenesis protein CcsB [Terrabacter sp. MAHUQ-38]MBC9822281.1 c-type cytochrome biogenesis protein CcsB [Terrabacter sp. MAHUQ-38]